MAKKTQPAYSKDDKVLCYHGPSLYEAKIIDVRQHDADDKHSGYNYKVHYKGWKNTWDDWVGDDRLRAFTNDNIELAQNLRKELESQQRSKQSHKKKSNATFTPAGSEDRGSSTAPGGARPSKRGGRDFEIEREEVARARPEVKIPMPDRLKSILVDDWENVTKHLQLVPLPSKTPVSLILQEYYDYEKQNRQPGTPGVDILEEMFSGLKWYFKNSLGKLLLYKFERAQYASILKEIDWNVEPYHGKQLDEIYGCEHLLRLLVSMPELIAKTNMDTQSINRLREELFKLNRWLSRDEQVQKYLSVAYETTSKEYQETAKA